MSAPKTNHHAWLARAENDLLNIENNLAASRVPWDTICFHAQQAAEKFLKTFLVYHIQPVPRTHDLVALLAQCTAIEPSLVSLENNCHRLSYYQLQGAIPTTSTSPPNKTHAKRPRQHAKSASAFLLVCRAS